MYETTSTFWFSGAGRYGRLSIATARFLVFLHCVSLVCLLILLCKLNHNLYFHRASKVYSSDYCNAVFAGLPDSTLAPLQRVLHAAARFVDEFRPRDHVTESLMSLHWLSVRERITYKLCSLMHGIVHGHAPRNLKDTVVPVADLAGRCHLRSAQDGLFDIPRSRTAFGSRAFSTTGPQAWNQLPTDIRNTATYTTFKHNLKTFLFNIAYGL